MTESVCPVCGRPDGGGHEDYCVPATKWVKDLSYKEEPQFPVHYTGRDIEVFTNSSGEVFVENTKTGVQMRINATKLGLRFTTNNFTIIQPTIVNNLIGWSVEGK
ncbi:MAG: hypothetical protein JHC33_02435 [Ignisphaera sp.]|nr:hypothetical protein [Ignisphaera sp.]